MKKKLDFNSLLIDSQSNELYYRLYNNLEKRKENLERKRDQT